MLNKLKQKTTWLGIFGVLIPLLGFFGVQLPAEFVSAAPEVFAGVAGLVLILVNPEK